MRRRHPLDAYNPRYQSREHSTQDRRAHTGATLLLLAAFYCGGGHYFAHMVKPGHCGVGSLTCVGLKRSHSKYSEALHKHELFKSGEGSGDVSADELYLRVRIRARKDTTNRNF